MAGAKLGADLLAKVAGMGAGAGIGLSKQPQVSTKGNPLLQQFVQATKNPNNGLANYVNTLAANGNGNFQGITPNLTPPSTPLLQGIAAGIGAKLGSDPAAQAPGAAAGIGQQAYNGPSLQDIINQYAAKEVGSAPNEASYFSAAPYNQALATLANGDKTATGQIGSAYQQAAQNNAQTTATFAKQLAANNAALKASQNGLTSSVNADVAAALAAAGPGGGVKALLTPLKANAASQNAAETATNNTMNSLFSQANAGASQDLGANKQAALGYLASQVAAERDKIAAQEATDRQTANRAYAGDLASYNKALAAAKSSAMQDILKQAEANMPTESNRQAAANTLAQWNAQGANGDGAPAQNAEQNFQLANDIINGWTPKGQSAVGGAKNLAEAQANLNTLLAGQGLPTAGIQANVLRGILGQYYGGGNVAQQQPSDAYLAQLAQALGY